MSIRAYASALVLVVVVMGSSGGCSDDQPDRGPAAAEPLREDPLVGPLRALEAESQRPAEVRFEHGFPTSVAGRFATTGDNPMERAHAFIDAHRDLYGQASDHLALLARRTSGLNDESVLLYQLYDGIEVYGGEIAVHLADDFVIASVGQLLTADTELSLVPELTAQQALEQLRIDLGRPMAAAIHEITLVIFAPALQPSAGPMDSEPPASPSLAWRIVLDDAQYIVDAHDAKVLVRDAHSNDALDAYDLGIFAWVPEPPPSMISHGILTADESMVQADWTSDAQVATLFDASSPVWSAYDALGIAGWDAEGVQLEMFIHEDIADQGGAEWNPFYGYLRFSDEYTANDVLGHEYTHAVIDHYSKLAYHDESGALNESLADTMGNLIENEDWLCAEDAPIGAIRDQNNPPHFGDPDVYLAYVDTENDHGGVHTNSGIISKASVLLTGGGVHNGITVVGVDRERSRMLHVRLITGLTKNADFAQARDLAVALSTEWATQTASTTWTAVNACEVRNAFAAVGIGYSTDHDCDGTLDSPDFDDDNDGVPDGSDNCPGVQNPSQKNSGLFDLQGDACDSDDDNDGVHNAIDNCSMPNPNQADADHDGIGDACDDIDGDGVENEDDNCPDEANADQNDSDRDGIGDVCEPDYDGDGLFGNEDDNCPFVSNADQVDGDEDGLGDACDPCTAVDSPASGWTAGNAEIGLDPQPFLPDGDGDGIPDACDTGSRARAPQTGLKVDGTTQTIDLLPSTSDDVASMPIPICVGDCAEWLHHWIVQLDIGGAPDGIPMYVRDDLGQLLAFSGPPRTTSSRATLLRFAAQGGRRYRLYSDLPAGFAGASFTLTARAGTNLPAPTPCTNAIDCDDGSACSSDLCDAGVCSHGVVDGDGDGFAATALGACGSDCNDDDAAIHPGASDGCGGGDEDCDGTSDEDETVTCHEDRDADGYGSDVTVSACGPCPTGYVPDAMAGDCFDDTSSTAPGASVFPGQTGFFRATYCNGAVCSFDYDCSGQEEPEIEAIYAACSGPIGACMGSGWVGSAPACGATGSYQACNDDTGLCMAARSPTMPTQLCH